MSRIATTLTKPQAFTALVAASLIAVAACWPAADARSGVPVNNPQDAAALVGPIALYPDDLIAVILPASTYPVQIVEATRFLNRHEKNRSLQPDPAWDDTVVALLNYPQVLRMMSANLNWTTSLGQAVLDSQAGVMDAIQAFRERAYAAGNLRSDAHQSVSRNGDGTIEIRPKDPEVVYIPYYVPQRAVVRAAVPVVHYFAHPFPLYDYPYPAGYSFSVNFFWGVTSAFSISWRTHALDYCTPRYRGHPYHGRHYYAPYYVRRDRDDSQERAREHVWHSDRHRVARPERRARYVDHGWRRRGSAFGPRRRDADFRSQRNFGATAERRHRRTQSALHRPRAQSVRRPRPSALTAQGTHDRAGRRGAVRTEQPPHRPSTRHPIRRARAYAHSPAVRSAGRHAPRFEHRRSGAPHAVARHAERRVAERRGGHRGRRTRRR